MMWGRKISFRTPIIKPDQLTNLIRKLNKATSLVNRERRR